MKQIDIIRRMLVGNREPEQVINDDVAGVPIPYLLRWHVRKDKSGLGNIYLHNFLRSDYERALHDHPWWSVGILLDGSYREHLADGSWILRGAGEIITRPPEFSHRVELINEQPTWSLFMTGPKVREWGFHCAEGWTHWTDFVADRCG